VGLLRFDGRVALVTGGARGMGRAYANLLAERGAKVVINDLGGGSFGDGSAREPALEAVAEITAKGGVAVANFGDVGSPEAAQAMVDQAVDQFGQLDIVINNAGIARFVPFEQMTLALFEQMMRIHVYGPFLVTRAAWPHLVEQGYGRVVMTCSDAIRGGWNSTHYAAAKSAVIGFMTNLSVEGQPHGINVNVVWPSAETRLFNQLFAEGEAVPPGIDLAAIPMPPNRSPDAVAPAVAWLVHDACEVTGQQISSGSGYVARIFLAQGPGFADADLTVESVRDHWSQVVAESPTTGLSDIATTANAASQPS
jgi:NAD(P)-dependent dehydrogenase (short-subunit alcohol dehydrogenase family)